MILAITFQLEMLETQAKSHKIWILAQFPIKTWVKLPSSGWAQAAGNLSQIGQKPAPLMKSLTKKHETQNQNIFLLSSTID